MIDRWINLGWISGGSLNLIQLFKLANFNEVVVIVTGVLAVVLLVYQIINKILQNRDLKLHIKKEELEISREREERREIRRKRKERQQKSK